MRKFISQFLEFFVKLYSLILRICECFNNHFTKVYSEFPTEFCIKLRRQGLFYTLDVCGTQTPFFFFFFCILTLQKLQICMLFRGVFILNYPKFIEICCFSFILYACPAFLKHSFLGPLFLREVGFNS